MQSSVWRPLSAELSVHTEPDRDSAEFERSNLFIKITKDLVGHNNCPQVSITKRSAQNKIYLELTEPLSFFRNCQVVCSALFSLKQDHKVTVDTKELLQFLRTVEKESELTTDFDSEFFSQKMQILSYIRGWYKSKLSPSRNQDLNENLIRLLQFNSLYKLGWLRDDAKKYLEDLHKLACSSSDHVISRAWNLLEEHYPLMCSSEDQHKEIVSSLRNLKPSASGFQDTMQVSDSASPPTPGAQSSAHLVDSVVRPPAPGPAEDTAEAPKQAESQPTESTAAPKPDWSEWSVGLRRALTGAVSGVVAAEVEERLGAFGAVLQDAVVERVATDYRGDVEAFVRQLVGRIDELVGRVVAEYFLRDFGDHQRRISEQKPKYRSGKILSFVSDSKAGDQPTFGILTANLAVAAPADPTEAVFFECLLAEKIRQQVELLKSGADDYAWSTVKRVADLVVRSGEGVIGAVEVMVMQAVLGKVYEKELSIVSVVSKSKEGSQVLGEFWEQVFLDWSGTGQPISEQIATEYLTLTTQDTSETIKSRLCAIGECSASQDQSWSQLQAALEIIDSTQHQGSLAILIKESQKCQNGIIEYLVSFYVCWLDEISGAVDSVILLRNLESLLSSDLSDNQVHKLIAAVWRVITGAIKPNLKLKSTLDVLFGKVLQSQVWDLVVKGLHTIIQENLREKPANTYSALYTEINTNLIRRSQSHETTILVWDFAEYEFVRGEVLDTQKLVAANQIYKAITGQSSDAFSQSLEQHLSEALLSPTSDDKHQRLSCWLAHTLLSSSTSSSATQQRPTKQYAHLQRTVHTITTRTSATGWGISPDYYPTHGCFVDRLVFGEQMNVETLEHAVDLFNLLDVNGLPEQVWTTLEQCLPQGSAYLKYLRELPKKVRSGYGETVGHVDRLKALAHAVALMAPATFCYSVSSMKSATFFPPMINWEDEDTRACLTLMHEKQQPDCPKGGFYRCLKCGFPVLNDEKKAKFTCLQLKHCVKCNEILGPFPGISPPTTVRGVSGEQLDAMLESKRSEVPTRFCMESADSGKLATKFEDIWVLMKYPDIPDRAHALVIYFIQHLFYSVWLDVQSESHDRSKNMDAVPITRQAQSLETLICRDYADLCITLQLNQEELAKKLWVLLYNITNDLPVPKVVTQPRNPFADGSPEYPVNQGRYAIGRSLKLDRQSTMADLSALNDFQQRVSAFFDRREWMCKMMTGVVDNSNFMGTLQTNTLNALFLAKRDPIPEVAEDCQQPQPEDDSEEMSERTAPNQDPDETITISEDTQNFLSSRYFTYKKF